MVPVRNRGVIGTIPPAVYDVLNYGSSTAHLFRDTTPLEEVLYNERFFLIGSTATLGSSGVYRVISTNLDACTARAVEVTDKRTLKGVRNALIRKFCMDKDKLAEILGSHIID